MKINILIILLLFSIFNGNAQKHELGKVTIEELQEKKHPIDTSASAAILFKKGSTRFNLISNYWEIVTEVSFKIKIYKKDGLKYANNKVPYYNGGSAENVRFSNAFTYNLVDGKVQKTKLKAEGEFTKVLNENWKEKSILLPNVKEGSIIEFTYVLSSPFIQKFNDWYFQSDIPTDYVEYKAYMIKYFVYNTIITGYEKINLKKESQYASNYGEVEYLYSKQNIPALKEEAYVDNIDNYTAILKFNLASVELPNNTIENRALDWEGVVKTIYEDEDFGNQLKKTEYFEDEIKSIIIGLSKRDEKIEAIFNFVKSKLNWNEKYGYSCKEGVKASYKNMTGNVAEINLMLTAMLRYAGIDANPVLLSTKSHGVSIFPSLSAYNYVISAVEIENDLILLDATEKFSVPNVLPLRDLNWFGRLIRKDGTSSEVNLTPKSFSKQVTNLLAKINADGSINGQLRTQITDHLALSFRQKNMSLSNETYLEQLESKNDNIEISEYIRENGAELSKPIVESYSFKDTKSIEIIGDKIYLSPLLFLNVSENPFKQEKREYPVDFGYPNQEKLNITLEIPEGYTVESIPTVINLSTGDEIGLFKYNIANSGNKIQVSISTDINTAIVPADYYQVLKEFFKKMIEKQNEKIVLKKA
jgi:hypothetical protein